MPMQVPPQPVGQSAERQHLQAPVPDFSQKRRVQKAPVLAGSTADFTQKQRPSNVKHGKSRPQGLDRHPLTSLARSEQKKATKERILFNFTHIAPETMALLVPQDEEEQRAERLLDTYLDVKDAVLRDLQESGVPDTDIEAFFEMTDSIAVGDPKILEELRTKAVTVNDDGGPENWIEKARSYLEEHGIDPKDFATAAVSLGVWVGTWLGLAWVATSDRFSPKIQKSAGTVLSAQTILSVALACAVQTRPLISSETPSPYAEIPPAAEITEASIEQALVPWLGKLVLMDGSVFRDRGQLGLTDDNILYSETTFALSREKDDAALGNAKLVFIPVNSTVSQMIYLINNEAYLPKLNPIDPNTTILVDHNGKELGSIFFNANVKADGTVEDVFKLVVHKQIPTGDREPGYVNEEILLRGRLTPNDLQQFKDALAAQHVFYTPTAEFTATATATVTAKPTETPIPVVLQDIVEFVDEASVPVDVVAAWKSLNLETAKDYRWGNNAEWGWVLVDKDKEGRIKFVDYPMTFSLDGKETVVHMPMYFSQTTGVGNMVVMTALRANDETKVGLEVSGTDAIAKEFYAWLLDYYKDRKGTKFYDYVQMAVNGQMDAEFIRADLNMIPADWLSAVNEGKATTVDGAFKTYISKDGQGKIHVISIEPHIINGKLIFVEFSDISLTTNAENPSAFSTFESWIGGLVSRSLGADYFAQQNLLRATQQELDALKFFIDKVVVE